jgi:hypothetical protein
VIDVGAIGVEPEYRPEGNGGPPGTMLDRASTTL